MLNEDALIAIDVVIPAYNASRFIAATLQSVASQSHLPARLIVVDDGSQDDTSAIVEHFCVAHPEVNAVLLRQDNRGLSAARNAGIKHATSPWIALLDADDIWEPLKLEKQVKQLQESRLSNVGVVYCDYSLIDENGHQLELPRFVLRPEIRGDVRQALRRENCVAGSGSAVLVRRSLFEQVGLFDVSLCSAEDWDMWIRLANVASFDYVNEPLVKIRRHRSSLQANHTKMLDGELSLLNKLVRHGLDPWPVYRLRRHAAFHQIDITDLRCYPTLDPALTKLFTGWNFRFFALYIRARVAFGAAIRRVLAWCRRNDGR